MGDCLNSGPDFVALDTSKGRRGTYAERLKHVRRPDECDEEELLRPIWAAVNRHLGTDARSLPELVEQLGIARFGHRPKVADTFCGGGSIPFALEAFSKTYLESYARLHKKPRSVAEDRRNLELHILPALGGKKLAEITAADIAQFHMGRGACPSNANRCLALLSHVFSIGAKWGVISAGHNPCRGIKRFKERIRERFLCAEEVVSLGRAFAEVDGSASDTKEDWRAVNVLRLLVYTGARLSEILTLQWGWIHWDEGYARLPDSKTGTKTVPLPQPALDVLRKVLDEHGRPSKFVFPGARTGIHFTGIQKPWQRIRLRAGLPDVRIHDLRHCFASTAVAHGESLYLVGAVLGHRTTSTTQRYAHLAMQPILESANRTSSRLAALMQQTKWPTSSAPTDGPPDDLPNEIQ